MSHDPDGPPSPDSGLYGLDTPREEARFVCLPLPFEATVSYRAGTAGGPEAMRRASHQVDLWDPDFGEVYAAGVCLLPAAEGVAEANAAARPRAERVIAALAEGAAEDAPELAEDLAAIEAAGERVRAAGRDFARAELAAGRVPVILGGDHSVPQGAIEAAAESGALSVLHLDAHADLRVAYEGFRYSHASIMHNVLEAAPEVSLVQVGLRDLSTAELDRIEDDARVKAFLDPAIREARLSGGLAALLDEVIADLGERVWLSFDIDGLDPTLCPETGTPVPGGLRWDEVCALLTRLAASGREVVGMDLVEVAAAEWDAIVGARLLYKMMGAATASAR